MLWIVGSTPSAQRRKLSLLQLQSATDKGKQSILIFDVWSSKKNAAWPNQILTINALMASCSLNYFCATFQLCQQLFLS